MDRLTRQKLNREIRELKEVMNQMDFTEIYITFHPNRKEYTFFSASHENFSKIDHIFGTKQTPTDTKKF